MKLFKFEDYEVVVSEEALTLKPFKQLWQRDRSASKGRALNELSYIYFMYDPRSEYMFIINEDTRRSEVIKGIGLKPSWKEDKLIQEAVELYKELTNTTASILLDSIRQTIKNLRHELESVNFSERTNSGSLVYSFSMITSTLDKLISLSDKLVKAEKILNEEIKEQSKMRGSGTKKILEDGF